MVGARNHHPLWRRVWVGQGMGEVWHRGGGLVPPTTHPLFTKCTRAVSAVVHLGERVGGWLEGQAEGVRVHCAHTHTLGRQVVSGRQGLK